MTAADLLALKQAERVVVDTAPFVYYFEAVGPSTRAAPLAGC